MWSGVSRPQYEQLWDQSVEEFGSVLATDTADLAGFRNRGGKAILWHGWADQSIYAQGTIDYYQRVRERMGHQTPGFLRLFMAPGVAHCRGGPGPEPTAQFEALVKWVENGIAPEMLIAAGKTSAGATHSSRPYARILWSHVTRGQAISMKRQASLAIRVFDGGGETNFCTTSLLNSMNSSTSA